MGSKLEEYVKAGYYIWLAVSMPVFFLAASGIWVSVYFEALPHLPEKPLVGWAIIFQHIFLFVLIMLVWSHSMYWASRKWFKKQ